MKKTILLFSVSVFLFSVVSIAKEFEVFDGQFYNGLYYPLVDVIEWQDSSDPSRSPASDSGGAEPTTHMEFHLHSKDKPMDVAGLPGIGDSGKPVLWIMYDLKFRGEHICRRALAPKQFQEGMKLYTYIDRSAPDYDNIFFSSEPLTGADYKNLSPYTPPPYQACSDEQASNKPGTSTAAPAGGAVATGTTVGGVSAARVPASVPGTANAPAQSVPGGVAPQGVQGAQGGKKEGKGVGVDYDNSAVPFSF